MKELHLHGRIIMILLNIKACIVILYSLLLAIVTMLFPKPCPATAVERDANELLPQLLINKDLIY